MMHIPSGFLSIFLNPRHTSITLVSENNNNNEENKKNNNEDF